MGGLEPSSNQAGLGEQFKRGEKYTSPGGTNVPPLFGEHFSDAAADAGQVCCPAHGSMRWIAPHLSLGLGIVLLTAAPLLQELHSGNYLSNLFPLLALWVGLKQYIF
jgi:hypothetical protein